MQVSTSPSHIPCFNPFNLTISFESAEEVAAVFALFNHSTLTAIVGEGLSELIRDGIRKGNGRMPDYTRFHEKFRNALR